MSSDKIRKVEIALAKFEYKIDKCILEGLINDSNNIVSTMALIKSEKTETVNQDLKEIEKELWPRYARAKDKFEKNCACAKLIPK